MRPPSFFYLRPLGCALHLFHSDVIPLPLPLTCRANSAGPLRDTTPVSPDKSRLRLKVCTRSFSHASFKLWLSPSSLAAVCEVSQAIGGTRPHKSTKERKGRLKIFTRTGQTARLTDPMYHYEHGTHDPKRLRTARHTLPSLS